MERKWLKKFIELLPDNPRVLDIGCGTGEPIALYLLENGCAVTGIDAAPEMIESAEGNFPDATWNVADMRSLDIGVTFDGLLAWGSFFHLKPADQREMFSIFRRHAVGGAPLMFTSCGSFGDAIGSFQGEPLYHSSLDSSEYHQLLDQNGFEVVDYIIEDPDCGHQSVWIARLHNQAPFVGS